MLIQDPSFPRFTYQNNVTTGISRMMNLTHFVGLEGTGRQLIAIQTYGEKYFDKTQEFLEKLKKAQLIDPNAYLLKVEPYIYETGIFYREIIHQLKVEEMIEVLQTGHIQNLVKYISRWKEYLRPYKEAQAF